MTSSDTEIKDPSLTEAATDDVAADELYLEPGWDRVPLSLRIRSALNPKWSVFTRVGESFLLKTSFVWLFAVPMIAKLFSKVGPDVTVVALGESWTLHLELPFSWKLFYFSSFSFTIAMILYEIFCPAIVRKYRTYSKFIEEGKSAKQVRDYFCDFLSKCRLTDETAALASGYLLEFSEEYSKNEGTLKDVHVAGLNDVMNLVIESEVPDLKTPDAFWYVRNVSNGSRPWIRFFTAIFFFVGFILIGGVLVQNFYYVWSAVFLS